MNAWEPTSGDSWGGRPVARRIAEVRVRRRVVVTATVLEARLCIWRGWGAQAFELDDGTGRLTIMFGGLRSVPGMVPGVRCTVEGTALTDERGVVLWNPFYRFEPGEAPVTGVGQAEQVASPG